MQMIGTTALVNGAAGGLGLAIGRQLLQAGADIAMLDQAAGPLCRAADALDPAGGKSLALPVDLCDRTAVQRAVDKVAERFGRLDVLVDDAGTDVTALLLEVDANASAHHASKWGLLGFSRARHAELRPQGVRKSTVPVGGMRTPFLLDRFPDIDTAPLQDADNVAGAVVFVRGMPRGSVVAEITVLPERETSCP